MLVSVKDFPNIVRAFRMIDMDSGTPSEFVAYTEIRVPNEWNEYVPTIEAALAEMEEDDFFEFCCGDQENMEVMVGSSKSLHLTHRFLNEWFDSNWSTNE